MVHVCGLAISQSNVTDNPKKSFLLSLRAVQIRVTYADYEVAYGDRFYLFIN